MPPSAIVFLILSVLLIPSSVSAQTFLAFDDYFLDKAMRLDLFMTGDAKEEFVTIDRINQEAVWPESKAHLLDPFNNGRYGIQVYEVASNQLIYSRGFDTMLGEYKTTAPAISGAKRVFRRSVRMPYPKRPVIVVIYGRDKKNLPHKLFEAAIDPADYHIIKESSGAGGEIYAALKNGEPHDKVDLVFLAEGYTAEDLAKFKADVDKFSGYLFSIEPYRTLKPRFNICGVFHPSAERGMDEPRQAAFKKTVLDASFNAFDLDRYMLCEEGHRIREMAAQVPYDAIIILVNSKRYGGGGIYNDYCITTVDNEASLRVFVHEFGHSFAGLADEYYASEVSYNDFYPRGVEPLEPNITALLDPARVKWKSLLSPGIAIPTDWGKERIEALQAERQKNRKELEKELEAAKQKGLKEAEVKNIQEKFDKRNKAIAASLEAVRKQYSHVEDKVGVFEGAGYAAKGLYRPMIYCLMITSPKNEFCRVCQQAIRRMIEYYSLE
ncbi:MAG: M64 family metallopeptidase [Acidobacteriota bacterium]